ncbi:ABC multidrug transporter [Akanthomyces lecanii RCEF 1005]|uniref:ABC multidrug transporter n=1 Tax=Akanthomyces lecanii RCEF 1005 TaxID=1081108 RepID=A0A168J8W4_CORDF|nr:ABC multidrug transporter [Akanthomyces lecanii RCEF 1005]
MEGPHENPTRSLLIAGYLSSVRPCISEDIEDQEKASIRRLWVLDPSQAPDSEEVYSRQRGSWRLYMVYIDSIGRFKCMGLALFALLLAGSEFLPEIYMRVWTEKDPESGKWFIGYACLTLITFALSIISYWILFGVFAVKAAIVLHEQMLNFTMRATLGFLTSTKTGNLLNRFSQDTTLFVKVLPSFLFRTMYMFFSSVVLVAIILSSASFMSVSLPAIVVAIYFIQGFYLRTSRQIRHIDLEEKAPLYTYFCETAEGILYIEAFGWRSKNMANGYRLLDNSQQPYYLMQCIQQWLSLVLGLLTAVIAFILVSIVVWGEKGTSGPAVGLSFLSILNFQRTLSLLLEAWTGSETSVAAIARLEQFKKDTPQENVPEEPEDLPADWAPEGYIDFTNVSARYKPARDTPPIIRDFSLAVEAGDKVGLVGRTGSGKSSLLLALLGFLQYDGRVEIDGIDIKNIDPDFLRSRVISITQDSIQLNETVRKNLLPFTINEKDETATEEKTREQQTTDAGLVGILQSFNLWTQIVQQGGLNAMLADTGYSKGELQLFSIARAIVRHRETGSSLVLIDEATSNLDALRDQETQEIMREEFSDCTVLTIAHREETIRRVDFTVALDDGEMTSMGVPQVEADRIAAASQD